MVEFSRIFEYNKKKKGREIYVKRTIFAVFLILALLLSGCDGTTVTPSDQHSSTTSTTGDSHSTGAPTTGTSTPTTDPDQDPPTPPDTSGCAKHVDSDNDTICDRCSESVIVSFDFYSINDLHGKLDDGTNHPGVDELTTYLRNAQATKQNTILISAGDMWQGSAESNLTNGLIMTDWMNNLGFAGMALGNHEFDWGTDAIRENHAIAEFPFLAINVYDRNSKQLVEYCTPSTIVEGNGIQIGIIGAIGDCYSSIAVDKCKDVYFKTGRDLTALVKAESDKLRSQGADYIVYVIHDGYEDGNSGSVTSVTGSKLSYYYDTSLSNGYVDLVFEGHTHQGYRLQDEHGVYHLQNRGDNKGGISHVEISINSVTNDSSVKLVELISTSKYQHMEDDPIVDQLLEKYEDKISIANQIVGYNSYYRYGDELRQLVADLYYETGIEKWGDKYDIVLGGGYLSVRSPYNLSSGDITYGKLQSLFPFDNELMLCSIKGRDLWNKFFNTSNSNYFICYGEYGAEVKSNINMNATYYVVVDSYSALYAPNKLTVVEEFGSAVYARDLLAEYASNGGFE